MPDWRAVAGTIAQNAGIPPSLFVRQINQESRFDPAAVSPAGAKGIAQIVPQYHPGVDPMDPVAALKYAANWMAQLHEQYGNWRDALAHYNGGGAAVAALHAGRPFDETRAYLSAILGPTTAEAAEGDQEGNVDDQTPYGPQQRSPGQRALDAVIAQKGQPSRVETLKPNRKASGVDALPGETEPNPDAVHRFWFPDGTYLDTVAQGDDVAVQGGTALTRQPATAKPPGQVVGTNATDQWIVRQLPDGTLSRVPNPNYRPPAAPKEPNRKQIVTVNGKHYEYDPDTGSFTPAAGLPNQIKTETIGGRVVTTDADGNVLHIVDARSPEAIQQAGMNVTKTGLEIEKDRQALLPEQQLVISKQLQTIEYVKGLVASGQLQPEQADQYIANVKQASLSALRGTTPFIEQQQAQKVQNEAAGQATDLLRQRLATAGSVGDSFMNSILTGATHARLGPGQHLNIDPLALAKAYILENGGAEAQGATAGLLSRAGLPGGAPSAPGGPPAPIAAGLMAGAGIPGPSAPMAPGSYPVLQPPRGVPVALAPGAPAGV